MSMQSATTMNIVPQSSIETEGGDPGSGRSRLVRAPADGGGAQRPMSHPHPGHIHVVEYAVSGGER